MQYIVLYSVLDITTTIIHMFCTGAFHYIQRAVWSSKKINWKGFARSFKTGRL